MATGQRILDRIKAPEARRGVLPLRAFYGREPAMERARNRMYQQLAVALEMGDEVLEEVGARRTVVMLDLTTSVGFVDVAASPLEFLVWRGELETERDEEGTANVRFHTALRLRDLAEGARLNAVKTQSFSGMPGGGGRADVGLYQIDCIRLLGSVKDRMPEEWMFPMLEMVVITGEWLDLRHDPAATVRARRRRRETVDALLASLDCAAACFTYLPWKNVRTRWRAEPGAELAFTMPFSLKNHVRGPMAVTRPPVLPR